MKDKVTLFLLSTVAVSLIPIAGMAAPKMSVQAVEIIYSTGHGAAAPASFNVQLSDISNKSGNIKDRAWNSTAQNQTVVLGTPFKIAKGLYLLSGSDDIPVTGSFDITYTATAGTESVTGSTYNITVSNDGKSGDSSTFSTNDNFDFSADQQMWCQFLSGNDPSLDTPSRPFIEIQCASVGGELGLPSN